MKNIHYTSMLLLVLALIVCVFPVRASAVRFFTTPSDPSMQVGDHVRVDVLFDTENESINTVSGALNFNAELVTIEALETGSSLVSLWIEKPHKKTESSITFSGMIPGGLATDQGTLFSVVFRATREGEARFRFSEAESFLNDGTGDIAHTTRSDTIVLITPSSTQEKKQYTIVDTVQPEAFTITRIRDESLFDGKWFLVFATQDKGSGVASYRVCESLLRACVDGVSPYELKKQKLFFVTRVHAFDVVGNVRTAFLFSSLAKIVVILCSIFLFSYILRKYVILQRRKKKSTA